MPRTRLLIPVAAAALLAARCGLKGPHIQEDGPVFTLGSEAVAYQIDVTVSGPEGYSDALLVQGFATQDISDTATDTAVDTAVDTADTGGLGSRAVRVTLQDSAGATLAEDWTGLGDDDDFLLSAANNAYTCEADACSASFVVTFEAMRPGTYEVRWSTTLSLDGDELGDRDITVTYTER